MTADRFTRAVTWVFAADDALLAFLTGAGWGADSAHRELDLDGTGATRVKQVRLHTRSLTVLGLLRTWKPARRRFRPTRAGLALAGAVSRR